MAVSLLPGGTAAVAEEPKVKDVLQQDNSGDEEAGKQAEKPEQKQQPQGPVDEFDRGTPRSSFQALAEAAGEGDFERAAQYLDLTGLRQDTLNTGGPELARQLKIVFDRGLWVDVNALSNDPGGLSDDGLPNHRDSLGQLEVRGKSIDLHMQRVTREDGVPVWKISSATVRHIPELHQIYDYGAIGEVLSRLMPGYGFLGLQAWQWLMVVGLLAVSYLVAVVPTRLVTAFLRHRKGRFSEDLALFVARPLRLLLAVLLARNWIDVIHPGVRARAWLESHTLVTFIVTWVLILLVEVLRRYFASRLEAKGREEAVVLTRPAANIVQLLIVFIAIMVWLENLGFRVTSLLAGLGIGGLAVALATQKSLENLIGAITLFTSAPIHVGDFCRFGDKVGTIEEIGLRATKIRTLGRTTIFVPNSALADMQIENISQRERIWYHPIIKIRYDTTPDQLRYLLVEVRKLLYSHPVVDPEPARIRFVGFGESSLKLEVFAYIKTTDWDKYLGVAEDLNLQIMDIVSRAGTAFAYPTRTMSLEHAAARSEEAVEMAEQKVGEWRESDALPLPDFPDETISALRDTLHYPPDGSVKEKK